MKTGVEIIAAERARQITGENHTSKKDDHYINDELAVAACHYTLPDRLRPYPHQDNYPQFEKKSKPLGFPWSSEWWKPSPEDRVRELAKAGALIAAEIDRLNRQNLSENEAS